MSYQANRNGSNEEIDIEAQKQRNIQNNANNIRNASDIAIATGNPYAAAAGAVVKAADKATQGKSSEALGKVLNNTLQKQPGGDKLQEKLNQINESGLGDKMGQAAAAYNGMQQSTAGNTPTANNASQATADATQNSESTTGFGRKSGLSSFFDSEDKKRERAKETGESGDADIDAEVKMQQEVKNVAIIMLPIMAVVLIFTMIVSAVAGGISDFDDALGSSDKVEESTGEVDFEPTSKEAEKFYDRLLEIKEEFAENEAIKDEVDIVKIAAVFKIMNTNNNNYDYDYMTKNRIRIIANAMFDEDGYYNEELFKQRLTEEIFKQLFPRYTDKGREQLTNDVFEYLDNYHDFIGEEMVSCGNVGTCTYNIQGYYSSSSGNVSSSTEISNLKVKLTGCGAEKEVISFEDYVTGVAYKKMGNSTDLEAVKAQMVATRSAALASGNKYISEENGQSILTASCSTYTDASQASDTIKTAAADTKGQILVNDQGYVIESTYSTSDQNKFVNYANQGMNYKQILLQTYNSSSKPYGASDIETASCDTGNTKSCNMTASTGPFTSWRQYEGPWASTEIGNSGKTIKQVGCLATSVAILIAKSGVDTKVSNFNPGTFVEYISDNGGFSGPNFIWASASTIAPSFRFNNIYYVGGYSQQQKLNKIVELLNEGCYLTAEVKGNTGQHWVAIDGVSGSKILMIDPGSTSNDMWAEYPWYNTSRLGCYKVVN